MIQHKHFMVGIMLLLTSLVAAADNTIVARDAWVREAPPGMAVQAAYFTLENPGPKADKLVAVHSPDFEKIEIHTTKISAGIAHMTVLDSLTIPSRAVVNLAPGGRHLMLHNSRRALAAGMNVTLELRFESGTHLTLVAPVRRAESASALHH